MSEILFLLSGVVLGALITIIVFKANSGYGYFKLEKIPDEEDFYRINMRVLPYQKLDKKSRIILSRE